MTHGKKTICIQNIEYGKTKFNFNIKGNKPTCLVIKKINVGVQEWKQCVKA